MVNEAVIQERTEYRNLCLLCSFAVKELLGFRTAEMPGEHARGTFRILLPEEAAWDTVSLTEPVLLCERDSAGNMKPVPLFSGYPERAELKEEGGYRTVELSVVSGTALLDRAKHDRVFQSPSQTYAQIADRVTSATEHSAYILSGQDAAAGGTLIQYQETDWQFLKRMAARMGLPLVPDSSYYFPRFYIGLPEGPARELPDMQACSIRFDGRYYDISGRCAVDRRDFLCYDVKTGMNLSLGDRVSYEGRELIVSRREMALEKGEVVFRYRLAGSSYCTVPREENADFTGMSLTGQVAATEGEQVEMAFDIDADAPGGNSYGFAPATGNLMYCMPQKGTRTAFYMGSGDESQGIVTGCIRTNGADCEGTGTPANKSFRSEHGKGLDLHPETMALDSGDAGKIDIMDDAGVAFESAGFLSVTAKEGISLESGTGITLKSVSGVTAWILNRNTSLQINGDIDIAGSIVSLAGRRYQAFRPFDDAPVEGKFDWLGFTRNLAMGVLVAVACVAAAVLIPGLGAVAVGALWGAAIGAATTTVFKAGEELITGNVRSAEEAFRDVAISAISGAITGAIGAAFPEMNCVVSGAVDALAGILNRGLYAFTDPDMTWEEKLAYMFDPKQILVDFVSGMIIKGALDWLGSWIRNARGGSGLRRGHGTGEDILINTGEKRWSFGQLNPESSLNSRQRKLLELLGNPGDTVFINKKSVSMNDLRQLTNVTGDEFNMFTIGSRRLIIRGQGNEIRVSPEMYDDIISGVYGRFSGHTHPGYSLEPGPADQPFLKSLGQNRSSIWGNTEEGWLPFGQNQWSTQEIRSQIRREQMQKYYGH